MIRASLFCVTAVLLTLGAEASFAAFPGKPGPIAYSKVSTDEVAEGRVESVGGLFTHGPRIKQRPRPLTTDTGDHSPSYSADGRLIVFVHDDFVEDEQHLRDEQRRLRTEEGDRRRHPRRCRPRLLPQRAGDRLRPPG